MALLYGKSYTRQELLSRVGDISQIARIKPYRLVEGWEDGVQVLDVTTGSGLDFSLLASRGLDISSASYNGRSLAWRSATSDSHPAFFDHEGEQGRGWLRGFYGGLLITCGLTNAGANETEAGQIYGLHGRISNSPAYNVSYEGRWEGDEYLMSVTGKIRQATVFGENILMTRTISTSLGSRKIFLHDSIENMGSKRMEHMILYHINIGFPVVNEDARLISPTLKATPRDADAQEGQDHYAQFQSPQPAFREQVYFHEFAKDERGRVQTAIINKGTNAGNSQENGFGVYCAYSPEQLPKFIEWKMMGAGTYVVGMEPANCLVMGRAYERQAGTLQFLEPGEVRDYSLEIGVLSGSEEIASFENKCLTMIKRHNEGKV